MAETIQSALIRGEKAASSKKLIPSKERFDREFWYKFFIQIIANLGQYAENCGLQDISDEEEANWQCNTLKRTYVHD